MNDAMATIHVAQSATVILEWNSRGASFDVLWETVSSFAEHLIVLVDPQDELVVSPVLAADPRFSVLTANLHSHRGDALAEGIQRALEFQSKIIVLTDSTTFASILWERLLARLQNGTADCVLGYPQARLEIRDPRWMAHFAASITQFLARAALGYWNCPCPVSRCVALRSELFGAVRLDSLHRGSFFEPSLLARLDRKSTRLNSSH